MIVVLFRLDQFSPFFVGDCQLSQIILHSGDIQDLHLILYNIVCI